VHLTQEWFASVLALPDAAAGRHPRHPTGPDTPIRIVRSSGSTGTSKAMILRRRMHNFWISTIVETNFASRDVRFYAAYSFTTNCCRSRVETCLRLGATVILGSAGQDIIKFAATHVWILPRDMAALLRNIRGEWPSRSALRVILGGAAVSAPLHDEIVAKIGADVLVLYATNETGFIGTVDRDGVCSVVRDASVRIVDETGHAKPAGEPGHLLVRTPGMVDGYLNDPATSRRLFQEGWFLTGDIGVWLAPGRFQIVGRRDDVLNVGGLKMSPPSLEDQILRRVGGLRDVAVTSVTNRQGVEEL
jgi:acyl-coenzyme A synthetase/AMP-(fatty) acid ligase